MCVVISFDIFDTTLIRKCGKADNVFWIMAKKLFPEDKDKQHKYVMWRKTANRSIAKRNKNYKLEDIYSDDIDARFGFCSGFLLKTEYETEAEMLVANPIIIKKIEDQRGQGNKIAFLSDMYLNSSFLKKILIREDAFRDGDELFVSCEYNVRKDDGTLFELVRKELNPSKWIHYGDNELSDIRIPQRRGIKTNRVNFGYTKIEKQFENSVVGVEWGADYSILMGYLRYFRLTEMCTPENTFAIDYIAPLYYGYVKHVIDDAKNRGLKTLYFLSRDGYIFLKIAEHIPHDGINLRYLYVSRKSIQPAFRYIATEDELRATINGERHNIERQVSDKDCYDLLDAYFVQEGVYDENVALVDLGWFGSTRLMVNKLRGFRGVSQCFCYYLGVVNSCIPEVYGEYNAYSYSEKIANSLWHTFLLEEYFSLCPHPTTIGYRRDGKIVIPILNEETIIHQNIIDANINNCCKFAKEKVPVNPAVLLFYALNSFCVMDDELNKEYVELLFKVCRHEEFIFRVFSVKDLYSYIRNRNVTLNDKLSFDASFGWFTKSIANFLRKAYIEICAMKNMCIS